MRKSGTELTLVSVTVASVVKPMGENLGQCSDCQETIQVYKNVTSGLFASCGCGLTRSVKVAQATPECWQL